LKGGNFQQFALHEAVSAQELQHNMYVTKASQQSNDKKSLCLMYQLYHVGVRNTTAVGKATVKEGV
jgi:hypothetical protein